MVPWKAAINAGTRWIMTNCAPGLTNTVRVDYDKESLDYLRNTLGYDGIVLTDWNQMRNFGDSTTTSVTTEGIDLSTLTLEQLYARMFELGVNQIGCQSLVPGDDPSVTLSMTGYPDAVIQAVEEGILDISYIEASDRLVLREKFRSGVFENPYCEEDAFHSLDVLPLPAGTKLYFESTNVGVQADYTKALGEKTALAESMAEADVVVIDLTVLNDAAEQLIEDAQDAGKPIVISLNHVDPTTATVEAADALLFLNYSFTPDHGTALDGFTFRMEGTVFAELLFGDREPAGMIVKEIARDKDMDTWQWKDLAGDQGASDWVRLMLLATMKEDPSKAIPANWGDPLLQYRYGMRYGQEPAFEFDTLVLPAGLVDVVQQNFFGPSTVQKVAYAPAKSGEPFKASFLLWNHGADGILTVTAYDGETPIAEKTMAVLRPFCVKRLQPIPRCGILCCGMHIHLEETYAAEETGAHGLQVIPHPDGDHLRGGHHGHRGSQRVGKEQHRRRGALGAGRTERQDPPRRIDVRRDLQRHPEAQTPELLRSLPGL